jgi:putative alpha-1,2-mannosidase
MVSRRQFLQGMGAFALLNTPLTGIATDISHAAGTRRRALATAAQASGVSQYVDVFIGTGGHGHTYPGASMPFGMVQLSPDTNDAGWDASSGFRTRI